MPTVCEFRSSLPALLSPFLGWVSSSSVIKLCYCEGDVQLYFAQGINAEERVSDMIRA